MQTVFRSKLCRGLNRRTLAMTDVLAMATVLIGLTLCRDCGGCDGRRIVLPLVHFHIPLLLPLLGVVLLFLLLPLLAGMTGAIAPRRQTICVCVYVW